MFVQKWFVMMLINLKRMEAQKKRVHYWINLVYLIIAMMTIKIMVRIDKGIIITVIIIIIRITIAVLVKLTKLILSS